MQREPIDTLGKILEGADLNNAQRDAIHIAIMPCVAYGHLVGGEKVCMVTRTTSTPNPGNLVERPSPAFPDSKIIGIVDPYLADGVMIKPGEAVWVLLLPNTITGLRHDWTHPDLDALTPKSKDVEESKQWLQAFAGRWGFDYDEMLSTGLLEGGGDAYGNYITARGVDLHSEGELGADLDLFWYHLEILSDKHFDRQHRDRIGWSCSC